MSLCDRLKAYFEAHPAQWIDGRDLAVVAGAYAWRSRCSDLRKPPFHMVIENRLRRCASVNGDFTVSEYRWVPPVAEPQAQSLFELQP